MFSGRVNARCWFIKQKDFWFHIKHCCKGDKLFSSTGELICDPLLEIPYNKIMSTLLDISFAWQR